MRKSELLALNWSDIDFVNQSITINKTLATGLNNAKIIQLPKTKESIRTISLDSETIKLLELWKTEQQVYLKSNQNDFIICDLFGEHHDVDYPNRILNRIIKKYDLKKITVHGFRHTHCSLLFESGASIKAVQDRLGHSDIKTTMDIYAHVSQKTKDFTANNFANYLSN